MNKEVIGLVEKVKILGKKKKEVLARIDTGAESNSISKELVNELNLGPIIKTIKIKSVNGIEERPVIQIKIKLKNKEFIVDFNIANRKNMKYEVLIGQKILKNHFLIDPSK